jgi:hypothetical protein
MEFTPLNQKLHTQKYYTVARVLKIAVARVFVCENCVVGKIVCVFVCVQVDFYRIRFDVEMEIT